MIYPIIFLILGLLIGSFINVLVLRFPDYSELLTGRSKCPKCKKTISAWDLIPVLSYIFLLGRCRNCKKPISWQYPLVEILTGVIFFLLTWKAGVSYALVFYLIFASLGVMVLVYDAKFLEIPEVFSWLLLIFAIICAFISPNFIFQDFLLGGLIGGGILGILVGISNEKIMGSGDIKIGLAFGFLLGAYNAILFLFLAFVIGAFFGVILILIRGKKIKSEIAFAPFLVIAGIIAFIWGDAIINLYLKFAII